MNTEAAKQLLKKAIALNDPELIELANSLLDVEKISVVESPRYKCLKCQELFDTPKGKKSCPKCNGRKITPLKASEPVIQISKPSDKTVNPAPSKKLKPPPFGVVDLTKMAEMLKNIPTEGDASKDTIIKKKIESGQMNIAMRRPEAVSVKVTCHMCKKEFDVPQKLASKYFVCVGCVKT